MTKSDWQIEREQRIAKQAKAMKKMTDDQLKAIDNTFSALTSSLDMIKETNDLYMSDIPAMESAYWSMYHAFNKQENNNA